MTTQPNGLTFLLCVPAALVFATAVYAAGLAVDTIRAHRRFRRACAIVLPTRVR